MVEKKLFLDEDHNIVSEEKAIWLVVHIYDDDGNLKKEQWIDLKKEVEKQHEGTHKPAYSRTEEDEEEDGKTCKKCS